LRRALVILAFVGCASFEEARPSAPDASVDGAPAGGADGGAPDATASGFCASFVPSLGLGDTAYCRDFDDGRPAIEGWNLVTVSDGGAVALDSTTYVSPPASFVARLDPAVAGCSYARTTRDLGPVPILTRVAFDVRIGGNGTTSSDGASYFVMQVGECGLIFSANDQRGQVHLQIGAVNSYFLMLDSFPRAGTWMNVEATVRGGMMNQLAVSVDGKAALTDGPATLPASCFAPASQLQIRPGMHCEPTTSSAREVRIGNLVVVTSKF
jgi:hypothetical protein